MDKTKKIVPVWRQYHIGKRPKLPHCSVPHDDHEDPGREKWSCPYYGGKYCGLLGDEPNDICIPAVALVFDSANDMARLIPQELRCTDET